MVHRARERVRTDRPRFVVDEEQHRAIVGKFVEAAAAADEGALMALFAENATWTSDGGGKAAAVVNVLRGAKTLTKFVLGVRAKAAGTDYRFEFVSVNGTPGLVAWYQGRVFAVYSFETDGSQVTGVYTVLNPDKLKGVA